MAQIMVKGRGWRVFRCLLLASLALSSLRIGLLGAIFTVTSTNDTGTGSLRQAILDANTLGGTNRIEFNVVGTGVRTISPGSPLPPVLSPVEIDATTQPGYTNRPLIELNGSSAGPSSGLRLLASDCLVQGLAINRFAQCGILVDADNNRIRANFVGTDPSGTGARGNREEGILIEYGSRNVVGGTNDSDRNLVSANTLNGVYILYGTGNKVQGNFIGTTIHGNADLGNTNHGVVLYDAADNLVGGDIPGSRNLISGNNGSGVFFYGAGTLSNRLQGNFIGTDLTGQAFLRNSGDGVTCYLASHNVIGGISAGSGNLISGNAAVGIYLLDGATVSNSVQGNLIGTTSNGLARLPNLYSGIAITAARSNLIGGSSALSRNIISGNQEYGVFLNTNSAHNFIVGNYIGTTVAGTAALSNRYNGILIHSAHSNTVSGTNVISGNGFHGVGLTGGASANCIQGNFIGTTANGSAGLSNTYAGIRIESPSNLVGGTKPTERNIISGNGQYGIYLYSAWATSNLIQGNYLGMAPDGSTTLGNGSSGIAMDGGASRNAVGGTPPGAGNLVSGNLNAGIGLMTNAAWNAFHGNLIGTDATGLVARGNRFEAFWLQNAHSNTIGGAAPGERNVMSGNGGWGAIYFLRSTFHRIQGNLIGVAADGVSPIPNASHTLNLDMGAADNLIGGAPGEGNTIANAPANYSAVRVHFGTNNRITSNVIYNSGALGIDLATNGLSSNDICDADTGGNNLQNYPVLTNAYSGNGTAIGGILNSTAARTYLLQFYANPSCNPNGHGEGRILLGETTVTTSSGCAANFGATFPITIPQGHLITATATDPAGNTSEFSACTPLKPVPSLLLTSASGGVVQLSWTNTATGFTLKQTPNLDPPIVWTAVTNMPAVTNNQFVVTLPLVTTTNRFYALTFD